MQRLLRFKKGERIAPGLKIGLYGGTFDPPHAGHLHVARSALTHGGLDQVWWLVSPQNPLKLRQAAPAAERMAAVRKLTRDPRMIATDIEVRLGARYTIETVEALRRRLPRVRFVLILGGDSLDGFQYWRRWADIARQVPILVVSRPTWGLHGRLGPLPKRFPKARVPEGAARTLASRRPPAWTYITDRWRADSSTILRRNAL